MEVGDAKDIESNAGAFVANFKIGKVGETKYTQASEFVEKFKPHDEYKGIILDKILLRSLGTLRHKSLKTVP